MYEPDKGLWTEKTRFPLVERYQPQYGGTWIKLTESIGGMQCSVVVDGKILFLYIDIDYVDGDDAINLAWRQRVMLYDPKKDYWSEEKTGPTGGSNCFDAGATTGRYAPQRVYALMHTGEGDAKNWTFNSVYNPETNVWTTAKPLPVAVLDCNDVVVIDDVLYAIGTSLTYQYIPIGYGTVSAGSNTYFKSLVNNVDIVIVLVIIIGLGIGLFVYLGKRSNLCKEKKESQTGLSQIA